MIKTLEQFVEQYRRLCGHIARSFVAKRKRQLEEGASGLQPWENHRSGRLPAMANMTLKCNAEDLASAALVKLTQCPKEYWNQTGRNGRNNYVERVIMNAIIDEFAKQKKVENHEFCPFNVETGPDIGKYDFSHDAQDFFDTQPGRDGLAQATQMKFDAERVKDCLGSLTEGERLVIQFYFGLNGLKPLGQRAIADKLARTTFWVEHRMTSGLMKLRKELGYQISARSHSWIRSNSLKNHGIKKNGNGTIHDTSAEAAQVHRRPVARHDQGSGQKVSAIR